MCRVRPHCGNYSAGVKHRARADVRRTLGCAPTWCWCQVSSVPRGRRDARPAVLALVVGVGPAPWRARSRLPPLLLPPPLCRPALKRRLARRAPQSEAAMDTTRHRRLTHLANACALLLLLVMAITLAAAADGESSEPADCRREECEHYRVLRYYEELGCVRNDSSGHCCPTHFDCGPFESLDRSKCHYKGKVYEPGAQLTNVKELACAPTCTCVQDSEGPARGEAQFHCAHVDCPENFESKALDPGCYRKYSRDQCCSTGLECGNSTEGRSVVECVLNGKTFLEGQFIETPENQCLTCICQEGFNGTFDGPWCEKYMCEFFFTQKISDVIKCAPIYWKTRKCCPMGWHCPSRRDYLIGNPTPPAENDPRCTFGNFTLKVGDELRAAQKPCIKCRCDIPPYVTCAQLSDSECASLRV